MRRRAVPLKKCNGVEEFSELLFFVTPSSVIRTHSWGCVGMDVISGRCNNRIKNTLMALEI